MKNQKSILVAMCLLLLFVQSAEARDLVSAANTYSEMAKSTAKAAGIGGLMAGGVCFAIPGLDRFALKVLLGGVFCIVIVFAAPVLMSLASAIFGGL